MASIVVALLSTVLYGFGWQEGIQFQGASFTITGAVISTIGAVLVFLMLALSRQTKTFPLLFATNFVLFAWMFTCALPYLGELS